MEGEHESTLRTSAAWYAAFDVKPGDKFYIAPEDREFTSGETIGLGDRLNKAAYEPKLHALTVTDRRCHFAKIMTRTSLRTLGRHFLIRPYLLRLE